MNRLVICAILIFVCSCVHISKKESEVISQSSDTVELSGFDSLYKELITRQNVPDYNLLDSLYTASYDSLIKEFERFGYFDIVHKTGGFTTDSTQYVLVRYRDDHTIELRVQRDLLKPLIIKRGPSYDYFEFLFDEYEGARNDDELCKCTDWYALTSPYQRYMIGFIFNDSIVIYEQYIGFELNEHFEKFQDITVVKNNEVKIFNLPNDTIDSSAYGYFKYSPELYDCIKNKMSNPITVFNIEKQVDFKPPYVISSSQNGKDVLLDSIGDTIREYKNPLRGLFSTMYLWCTKPDENSKVF